jgi:hypothetical protein
VNERSTADGNNEADPSQRSGGIEIVLAGDANEREQANG